MYTKRNDSSGKRHCLSHIMVMSICGILNKRMDFEDIYDYAKAHEKWFDKKLRLWNGIPSARTFRNVFRIIPAEQFLEIFLKWINSIVKQKTSKQIIIDGKAIRGANKDTIDFFNDAIEKEFNDKVKSKKKEEELEYINKYNEKFEVYITRENTHGREEERIYVKSNNISWLKGKKWKHIKSVIMAINNTTVHDNSVRYYFSSIDLPIEELSKIIRKHWQIENNLHWVIYGRELFYPNLFVKRLHKYKIM